MLKRNNSNPICLTVCILCIIASTHSVDILIYTPSFSRNYVQTFSRIAETLADEGHNVVMVIPEYKETDAISDKLVNVIRMNVDSGEYTRFLSDYASNMFEYDTIGLAGRIRWQNTMASMCESVLSRSDELNYLRNLNFTIGFVGSLDYCGVGIMRLLDIPNFILVTDAAMSEDVAFLLGVPEPLCYVPVVEENDLGTAMTLRERIHNVYMWETSYFIHVYGGYLITSILRSHTNSNFPSIRDMIVDNAMCFVNSDELLDFARPIIHKTIYIGGLRIQNSTQLPEQFVNLVQKGDKGLIMVSLGDNFTNSSNIPKKVFANLFQAFSDFPDYQFLMEINEWNEQIEKLAARGGNIEIVQWMPRSNLLGQNETKLLITSGGMNDIIEATMKGVPVLVIPLIRDQFYNARVIEYRGLGLYIRKTDLHNYATVRSTLHKLLDTKRFSQNAKRFSAMLNNRANRSRDLLLHWTDLIAEFGSLPELRPYGGNYRTVKYFTIDVIITCLLSVIASLIFKFSLVFVLYRLTKKLQLTAVDLLSSQKRKKTV